jgi:hypothetical protein
MTDDPVSLPTWDDCHQKVIAGTATALERFIFHNEPEDIGPEFQTEADFRKQLAAMIAEVRS